MKKHHDSVLIAVLVLLMLLIPEECIAIIPLCILACFSLFKLLKAAAAGGFFDESNM